MGAKVKAQSRKQLAAAAAAASAAASLQLCPTLCDPIDGSPSGSPSLRFSRQELWSGLPFPSPMHESEKWKWSRSGASDSSWPHGLQPTRLLCPWDFPGKSTGVGCHCMSDLQLLKNQTTFFIKDIQNYIGLMHSFWMESRKPWPLAIFQDYFKVFAEGFRLK